MKFLLFTTLVVASNSYTESLDIQQFPDGKLLTTFYFSRKIRDFGTIHFDLLPKTLGEVFMKFRVKELHLTFTHGQWRVDRYGYSKNEASVGAALWTWLEPQNIDDNWIGLSNSLGGLFCASLNFMDLSTVSEPVKPFEPRPYSESGLLRYSTLPRESICTENLTPFTKLLPCNGDAGIASLFNPHRILDGNYQSITIHWIPHCLEPSCESVEYELLQTVSIMHDPVRVLGTTGITRYNLDWSFQSLFVKSIASVCPLADETTITVKMPNDVQFDINPAGNANGQVHKFKLTDSDKYPFDLKVQWAKKQPNNVNPQLAPIRTFRRLGGSGQERGTLLVDFINDSKAVAKVNYFESLPWIVKTYLHTMKLRDQTGHLIKPSEVLYSPAIDRKKPTVLEFSFAIPAKSTVKLSMDLDFEFVRFTEHHPDANHGFDIGTGILKFNQTRTFSDPILVRLPTPDFSMPFNVITLTCTVFSVFFGAIYNMLTRKWTAIP